MISLQRTSVLAAQLLLGAGIGLSASAQLPEPAEGIPIDSDDIARRRHERAGP